MVRSREIRVEPAGIVTRLTAQEARQLTEAWLAAYGRERAPGMSQYKWHVFSYGTYPSAALEDARTLYAEAMSSNYVVLSNDDDEALVTDQKPSSSSLRDFYVFPRNLAWTMAFTHEDGWLGPFFAKHQDFERLNAENLQRIKKAAEAADAKQKGYW